MTDKRKIVWAALTLVLCGMSGACAMTAKVGAAERLPISVRITPMTSCEVSVGERLFTLPQDEERLVSALRELRRNWKAASVVASTQLPYSCVGHTVYIAQRAGFADVGFNAHSPSGEER